MKIKIIPAKGWSASGGKKTLTFFLIFTIISSWWFSGWPQIWHNPPIPPQVLITKAASEAFAYTGSTQYFNPANGIYAVTVECWGGGGGGGVINNQGGGGGGGGAYAKSTNVTVAPGSSYAVVIGAGGTAETAGANSTFAATEVVAAGGGAAANAVAGAGGLASNSTYNSIGSDGGTGGAGESTGTNDTGGGGGGAGGPNGAGLNGANGQGITLGGAGGDSNQGTGVGDGGLGQQGNVGLPGGDDLTYGGGGGGGGDDQFNGGTGGTPGGGGGGAGDDATVATGANGRCIVSYDDIWAPSVSQASLDSAWTFSTAPNNDAAGQISMAATTGYDYNAISYSFVFTACASNGGTGGNSSGWQAGVSYSDTGLDPNKCYGYTVQTRDSLLNTGTASAVSETYSSANVPGQPTLSGATATTLNLTNAENSNPASNPTTNFAVYVVTGDATWITKWVNTLGEPVASEVWMTDTQLDALVLGSGGTPLTAETTYGVQVKAKNENTDETILGTEGSGTTSAAAGELSVNASSTVSFGSVTYSSAGQYDNDNALNTVNVSDSRGGAPGWTVNVTGEDWYNASAGFSMDFDGDGSATGQLCMDITSAGSFDTESGSATGVSLGADACFTTASTTITLISATSGNGTGEYHVQDVNLDQYIPPTASSSATTYKIELVFTAQ